MASKEAKKKVYVGLSGGVDSSVSAALLKKAGYDVTGVFIKTWTPEWLECSWKEDRLDAMRVCAKISIPFLDLNLEKEYKRDVVDYMVAEYRAGRTPNPDVMCNKHIKFGGFFDFAMSQNADFVATGHYARILRTNNLQLTTYNKKSYKSSVVGCRLLVGLDANKDQSYFLWTLTQKQLAKTLFPVGDMEKPEVRKLAKKFGLPTADKKDSQGLCFMGKVDIKDFLSHYIKPKSGDVLNEKGEKIGFHDGAVFLTIGERHGFTVTIKTPNDAPYFIMAKDVKKNYITVSHKENLFDISNKFPMEILIKNVNWISGSVSTGLTSGAKRGQTCPNLSARVRYRQQLQEVRIWNLEFGIKDKNIKIEFKEPQIVAAGQSLVLYKGEECLGGGIII
ncbi:MAG TPA: tRNA 2-thiouridine(34) synthase MnmA [Candidatus Paceibacterota bacterium]